MIDKTGELALMAIRASTWLCCDVYDARIIEGAWHVRLSPNNYTDDDGLASIRGGGTAPTPDSPHHLLPPPWTG